MLCRLDSTSRRASLRREACSGGSSSTNAPRASDVASATTPLSWNDGTTMRSAAPAIGVPSCASATVPRQSV
ncbi:MAG: hypothetical protein WKG00_29605 [Polyangiaceae bacterium]